MNVEERYTGIQTILETCGKEGCLFLSLLSIIEEVTGKNVDLIEAIRVSQQKNYLASDFTVNDSPALLSEFTGKKWMRTIVTPIENPSFKEMEYVVCKWYNPRTQFYHFRRMDWDTLKHSVTVAEGSIIQYYIYKVV